MILPVQPYKETRAGYCGPATLKMVLAYYGVDQSEETLAQELGTTPDAGTPPEAIVRVAEHYGFKATEKQHSTFDDIAYWLNEHVPVIVDWFSSAETQDETADGHYSAVVGLDDTYIHLQDPELGRLRRFTRSDFLRVWFDFPKDSIRSSDELVLRQLIAIYRQENNPEGEIA
ncbi:MAG: C39 family peptidase [Candidatus Andersenbacteria bacterium]